MKNDFGLQNLIENGNGFNFGQSKGSKKSSRANQQEMQFQIGIIFNEICQMLEDNNIRMSIDRQGLKTMDKIHNFKTIVEQLLDQVGVKRDQVDNSNAITCPDCQTYEASLQKLQGQVRQHIRIQQQLKIFQDQQEEKIDQMKKQKKQFQKKTQHFKKQYEQLKKQTTITHDKLHKLEHQNDHHKKQIRELKRNNNSHNNHNNHHEPLHSKRQSHKQSAYAYESKQNKIDWMHRNVSVKKDDKQKGYERKSVEKRNDSAQKNWRMSNNAKSSKMISVMNDKLLQQKSKEERRRVIQSKFDYRR